MDGGIEMRALQKTGMRRTAIAAAMASVMLVLGGCYYHRSDAYYGGGPSYYSRGGHGPGYGHGWRGRGHDRHEWRGHRYHR